MLTLKRLRRRLKAGAKIWNISGDQQSREAGIVDETLEIMEESSGTLASLATLKSLFP